MKRTLLYRGLKFPSSGYKSSPSRPGPVILVAHIWWPLSILGDCSLPYNSWQEPKAASNDNTMYSLFRVPWATGRELIAHLDTGAHSISKGWWRVCFLEKWQDPSCWIDLLALPRFLALPSRTRAIAGPGCRIMASQSEAALVTGRRTLCSDCDWWLVWAWSLEAKPQVAALPKIVIFPLNITKVFA